VNAKTERREEHMTFGRPYPIHHRFNAIDGLSRTRTLWNAESRWQFIGLSFPERWLDTDDDEITFREAA
jgi:hypothetical protein